MDEQTKYYYALGIELGKKVVKEKGSLENNHRKLMLHLGDNKYFVDTKAELEKLLDVLLEAKISATRLCDLLDASHEEQKKAIWNILNASMKPIEEAKA